MPSSQFRAIVDSHPDISVLGIGGGEPLLHPELEALLSYALTAQKTVNLSTNLVDNVQKLGQFYANEHLTVQVNFPAIQPELYREITNRDACAQVVEHLCAVRNHLATVVNCVVYKKNFSHVGDLIDGVTDLGIPVRVTLAYPIQPKFQNEILAHDQVVQLASMISAKRLEGKQVYSGVRFSDGHCTDVVIPCSVHANSFGCAGGPCCEDRVYYNVAGNRSRCEFEVG
jgi:molybdenum cofactor biosynthesis enzyme MoaA